MVREQRRWWKQWCNLIILVACYESKTRLFVTSEVPIFKIFSDDASAHAHQVSDHMRSVMDDLVSCSHNQRCTVCSCQTFRLETGSVQRHCRIKFYVYRGGRSLRFRPCLFKIGADGKQGMGSNCRDKFQIIVVYHSTRWSWLWMVRLGFYTWNWIGTFTRYI